MAKKDTFINKSVLLVTDNLRYGGAETYTVYLANELANRGYRVCVLANDGPIRKLLNKRIKYFKSNLESGLLGVLRAAWQIARISRQEDIAIVHTQKLESTQAAWLAKFLTNLPVIKTAHGYTKAEVPKLSNKIDLYSDKIITVADFLKDRFCKQGIDKKKMENIFNGIDTKLFKEISREKILKLKKRLNFSNKERVVISVARIIPKKGFEELVHWFPFVLAKVPSARLVIVGDGEKGFEIRENLIRECKINSGLYKYIKFVNGTHKIPVLLRIGHVYCAPAVARGMAVLEAMAAGLPVVGAKPKGNPQVVMDGETGFIVSRGDGKALAEKISLLLQDEELSKRLGEKARESVEELFSLKTMTDEIEKVYREAINYNPS